jgi:hypothetical protein
MKLSKIEWNVLNELQDQDEPFEAVDRAVERLYPNITPDNTLDILFQLTKYGFITIRQEPITAFGQKIERKQIIPKNAQVCLGDLIDSYKKYCIFRDYIEKKRLSINDTNLCGIPFGLWVEITNDGQIEYEKEKYSIYWPKGA